MKFDQGKVYISPLEVGFIDDISFGSRPGEQLDSIRMIVRAGFLDWASGLNPPLPGQNADTIGMFGVMVTFAQERVKPGEEPIGVKLSDEQIEILEANTRSAIPEAQANASTLGARFDEAKGINDLLFPEEIDETELGEEDTESLKALLFEEQLQKVHAGSGIIAAIDAHKKIVRAQNAYAWLALESEFSTLRSQ